MQRSFDLNQKGLTTALYVDLIAQKQGPFRDPAS